MDHPASHAFSAAVNRGEAETTAYDPMDDGPPVAAGPAEVARAPLPHLDAPSPAMAVEHSNPDHARITLIDWMLGNRCNYACSYCPSGLHDGSLGWQPAEDVERMIDRLVAHYHDGLGRTVWIQFTGGEPTLNPQLPRILAHARDRGCKLSLISNGSRTPRYWQALLPKLESAILTYHGEGADPDGFFAIAETVASAIPLQVNVAVAPDRFDELMAIAERLWRDIPKIDVVLKPLRLGFGTALYPYAPEQLARLRRGFPSKRESRDVTPRSTVRVVAGDGSAERRRANQLILDGANRWAGFRCMAGVESLRIQGNGRITRAVCGVGGALGTLADPPELPLVGTTCDKAACACVADILISKRRRGVAA